MNANALALGRNHSTSDTLSVTVGADWARVDIRWNDGAHVSMVYYSEDGDFHALAKAHAARLGWSA